MANPHKGEVEFESGRQKYKLRFSADAISNLEDALDMNVAAIGELMGDAKRFRLGVVKSMFIAALKDQHDELDDKAATKLFKAFDPPEAIDLVVRAFNQAFNVGPDASATENPPKPASLENGTSPASGMTG